MAITILEGSTFCICDELGDVGGWATSGFFSEDTRFLSTLQLRINGRKPLLLSSDKVDYFSAAFYLRNPPVDGLEADEVSIIRERFIGEAMQDHVVVQNQSMRPVSFELSLEFASDFADIFAVKDYDFALGDPVRADPLPPPVEPRFDAAGNQFVFADETGVPAHTQVILSQEGEIELGRVVYRIELAPRERWQLRVDIIPSLDGEQVVPRLAERRFGDEIARVRESLAAWHLRVPQLRATWDDLAQSFGRSVSDLASLRMRGSDDGMGKLPAAGMPWFMTVFGRDTIITCLQTLIFGPELAVTALEALRNFQSHVDDPNRDAEPGKIVHEVRRGKAARSWHGSYYGTVDATPLYLILLSEVWRWTDDAALVHSFRDSAMEALDWIATRGDLNGDGFVEYLKRQPQGSRQPVVEGLARLAAIRGRSPRRAADRAVRGAGLRLRREAPDGRARAGRLARPRARGAPRPRSRRAAGALQRGLLGAGAQRLLRARARQGRQSGRLALFQRRPPALERHRPAGARRGRRRPADGRRACGRGGESGRCPRTTAATTRSRTTTARFGPTTTP